MSDARDLKTEETSTNEAISQLRYLQSVYSQQYELLESQIATYTMSIDAILKGLDVLNNLSQIKNSSTLINTGPGIYIEGKISDTKSLLTYIGAGYIVEKTADEANTFVESNKQKQEEVLKKMISDKNKIQGELIDILYKLEALQQQVV